MKHRVWVGLAALLFAALGIVQSAQAQGGDRISYWVENTSDGCANIYIYINSPWGWPWLALNSGAGDEAPLDNYDVQPKYVCPFKNKGERHVNYVMTARFSDGYVETHNFYYDVNGSFPTRGGGGGGGGNMGGTGLFYANPQYIAPGQCTTLRWDIDGVNQIYFQGQGVTGHESRWVCLYTTTTYFLTVVQYGGGYSYPQTTVYVGAPPPVVPPPVVPPPVVPPSVYVEKLVNLNDYCAFKNGAGAYSNFTNFNDPYSWGCYRNGFRLGGIDMNEACRTQHPDAPNAYLRDPVAYGWACRN